MTWLLSNWERPPCPGCGTTNRSGWCPTVASAVCVVPGVDQSRLEQSQSIWGDDFSCCATQVKAGRTGEGE